MDTELQELKDEVWRLRELMLRLYRLPRAGKDVERAQDEYAVVCEDHHEEAY